MSDKFPVFETEADRRIKELEQENEQLRIKLGGAEEAAKMLHADKKELEAANEKMLHHLKNIVAHISELQNKLDKSNQRLSEFLGL